MHRLSFVIFNILLLTFGVFAQSPHGDLKKLDCGDCHHPNSWKIESPQNKFSHDITGFSLTGRHKLANCESCHLNLKFSLAQSSCSSCHKDIHQNTLNLDCSTCHKTDSWLVENSKELHSKSRFPLVGSHLKAECIKCHAGYPNLNFATLGISCFDCHRSEFNSTQSPNHLLVGFSTDCLECHSMLQDKWSLESFVHNFFPLEGGHKINNCFSCHKQGGDFKGLSKQCYSCHSDDYEFSSNPPHLSNNFPTDCQQCHTIQNWKPASFDHSNTQFPLNGAHISVSCSNCHQNNYSQISTECVSCHQNNFNSSTNPNHVTLALSTNCISCHSTNPGWKPAKFDIHNTFYQLIGAHAQISNNCNVCHNGNYNNTPNTCFGCHANDFNSTTNPPHSAAGFNTECQSCHSQNSWKPANWNHDTQYFPIYSGKHKGKWNVCSDCHTVQSNYNIFSCIDCHEHNKTKMDNEHRNVSGYVYASTECYTCHPNGTSAGAFNHSLSNFPLTGAHQTVECNHCHQNGYANTPTECISCHQTQYNNSTNPSHTLLALSIDCAICHTTNPDWQPALFPQHNDYFPLTGAHSLIADNCNQCHNNNYSNLARTCVSCHQADYQAAANPNHVNAGIANTCESCHNSTAWIPSTFNHTTTGFELTGQHSLIQCSSCHLGTTTGLNSECISCHQNNYNTAVNHVSQGYPYDCKMCHNTVAWNQATFNHNNTNFQLTGAHIGVTCSNCHTNGFSGTPSECISCHASDYNNASDPNHVALNLSNQCQECHTTNPDWKPAAFPNHSYYFQFVGAHIAIQNNCSSCHINGYSNTPTECYGCHQSNYQNAVNPPHQSSQFPTDCKPCHTQSAWRPSTFNHDGPYFPIYSGKHKNKWTTCSQCHTNPSNYTIFSCIDCHEHRKSAMDNKHQGVNGYVYSSPACYDCHPRGNYLKTLKRNVNEVN